MSDVSPPAAAPARTTRLALPLVLALTLATFAGVCRNAFVLFDDPITVACNAQLAPVTAASVRFWWTGPVLELYAPLTYTTWGAIACVAHVPTDPATGISQSPLPYHLAGVLAHLVSTLLVYLILRQLGGKPWPAAFGAALFGVHPIQVETVAWVTAFNGGLSAMLALAALWAYLRFARADAWRWYALATSLLVLALLAKSSAVVAPACAAVLDLLVLRRPLKGVVVALLPWFALAAAAAIYGRMAQPVARFDTPYPSLDRVLVACDSFDFYVAKVCWPLHVGPDYHRTPHTVLAGNGVFFAALGPLALAMILLRKPRRIRQGRRTELTAGVLVFFLALAPTLGAFRFTFQSLYSTVADRYAYFALLGPALIVATILSQQWSVRHRRIVTCFCVAIAMSCTTLSARQVRAWRDTASLHALQPYGLPRVGHWPGHLVWPTRSHRDLNL